MPCQAFALRPMPTMVSEEEIQEVESILARIAHINDLMGIGVVNSKAEDIAVVMKNPIIPIMDEIADVLTVYFSILTHTLGSYTPAKDAQFRETTIYQKLQNAE